MSNRYNEIVEKKYIINQGFCEQGNTFQELMEECLKIYININYEMGMAEKQSS